MRDYRRSIEQTFREAEAKMDAVQRQMDAFSKEIDKQVKAQMKVIEERVASDTLKEKFANFDPIKYYEWSFIRSFAPRKCFTSNMRIIPGNKAYRGTIAPNAPIKQEDMEYVMYPAEIWLSKEEFTFRRLKGQI